MCRLSNHVQLSRFSETHNFSHPSDCLKVNNDFPVLKHGGEIFCQTVIDHVNFSTLEILCRNSEESCIGSLLIDVHMVVYSYSYEYYHNENCRSYLYWTYN